MNIGNVGATTYNTWASRTNGAKAHENNCFGNVADKKVMTCTAMGSNKVMLRSDALMSYASPQTGESVNIYRADNYSKENPMYIIMGLDADGNEFEQEVDASKINPNHCSYNELMVLNVETGHTSPSDYLHAVALRGKADVNSYFEKTNWVSYAQTLMKDYQTLGKWDSYLSMSKWLQSIMDYVGKADKVKTKTVAYNNRADSTVENLEYIQSFSLKEGNEFLIKFDMTEEESTILTSEFTMCTYPASNSGEEDIRYITWYTEEGIFCRKAGQTEGYAWTVPFENKEQYEKVMDFINQFSVDYNFRFAAHENFWTDYLKGEIDEETFLNFIEGTDSGIPNYATMRGDSVFVDTEKMKWAPYLNPLGAKFYTAEEFHRMQMELVEANAAKLPKITDSFEEQYKKAHPEYNGEKIFRFENSSKLYNLDEIPILMYQKFLQESGYGAE